MLQDQLPKMTYEEQVQHIKAFLSFLEVMMLCRMRYQGYFAGADRDIKVLEAQLEFLLDCIAHKGEDKEFWFSQTPGGGVRYVRISTPRWPTYSTRLARENHQYFLVPHDWTFCYTKPDGNQLKLKHWMLEGFRFYN